VRRLGLLALAAACLAAAVPATAGAAGQIGYDGCVANDASRGCADLPADPLTGDTNVAVSPAGDLYATGQNAVLHFFAAPQGQISYDGCLGDDASQGCGDLPFSPLSLPSAIAVSPNGGSVYVTSAFNSAVAHFFRAPEGQLMFGGCVADDGSQGCTDLPLAPVHGPLGVTVAPDGAVYVTGGLASSISHFLAFPQGQIEFRGCLANDAAQGCRPIGGGPLALADGVVASPDGKSLYVASLGGTVSRFDRLAGGSIAYQGCWGNDASRGCADLPFDPLAGTAGIAVSPNGDSVYVASSTSDSVAHFFRGSDGALTYDGCVANTAEQGCADLPGAPIDGASSVAVSPDGKSVYVASGRSSSVGHFFRAPQGQITWDGCLNDDGSQNCGDLPGTPLTGARSVGVSPNNGSVYVGAGRAVAHFFRAVGDEAPAGSVKTPGGKPGGGPGGPIGTPGAQRCFGKRATIVGTARGDRIKGTRRADVIVSLGGNDRISAGGGNDLICAGSGNDKVSGGTGNDRESGGSGNDSLKGDAGKDSLKGDAGKDLLSGGPGKDGLTGGSQKDRCTGGSARDRASGCERKSSL
jgi:DNA-binding beta-propeller fold protein YncE